MSHKPKSKTDLERRPPFREPRRRILIVCEGKKDEPNYFEGLRSKLRLSTVEIKIAGKECDPVPMKVTEYAIEKKKDGYDTIWCVMDVDNRHNNTLPKAIKKAKSENIKIALSNPCFEYWLLLHFEKISPQMDAKKTKKELKKAFKKHYPQCKKCNLTFEELHPRIDTAIANSKRIIAEHHYDNDISSDECNPCTHVHLVVEEILDIADRQ
jgi:hypothetical protein